MSLANTYWKFNADVIVPSSYWQLSLNFVDEIGNVYKRFIRYTSGMIYYTKEDDTLVKVYDGGWTASIYKRIYISGGLSASDAGVKAFFAENATQLGEFAFDIRGKFPTWLTNAAVGAHPLKLSARDSTQVYTESEKAEIATLNVGLNYTSLSSTSHINYNGYSYVNSIVQTPTLQSLSAPFVFYDYDDIAYTHLRITTSSITFYKSNGAKEVYTAADGWADERYKFLFYDEEPSGTDLALWLDANTHGGYYEKTFNGTNSYTFYAEAGYEMPTEVTINNVTGASGTVGTAGTWSYNRVSDSYGTVTISNADVEVAISLQA